MAGSANPSEDWRARKIEAVFDSSSYAVHAINYRRSFGEVKHAKQRRHLLLWWRSPLRQRLRSTIRFDGVQSEGALGQLQLLFIPAGAELDTYATLGLGATQLIAHRFDPAWLQYASLPPEWYCHDLRRCIDLNNRQMAMLMQRVGEEILSPGFGSDVAVECLSELLAIELHRYLNPNKDGVSIQSVDGKLSPRSIDRLMSHVNAYGDRVPSIQEIAQDLGITPGHLGRAFRKATGQSFQTYLSGIRIARAKEMIENGDASIDVIASSLGFSEASAFSHAFYKSTWMRPGAYRMKWRQ